MAEPATASAAAAYATIASGITLALFGVDYHSLLYGMVGALLAVAHAQQVGRMRAILLVALSTLIGAVAGTAVVDALSLQGKAALLLGCVVGGAGAQTIVMSLVLAAQEVINRRLGGRAGG